MFRQTVDGDETDTYFGSKSNSGVVYLFLFLCVCYLDVGLCVVYLPCIVCACLCAYVFRSLDNNHKKVEIEFEYSLLFCFPVVSQTYDPDVPGNIDRNNHLQFVWDCSYFDRPDPSDISLNELSPPNGERFFVFVS